MRIMFLSFVMVTAAVAAVAAEGTGNIQSAQNALKYTLSTLRGSVEKLTKDNKELIVTNEHLRGQLVALQNELSVLQHEDFCVLEQFSALEKRYQKKMFGVTAAEEQLAKLKKEEAYLTNKILQLSKELAAREQSDAELRDLIDKKEAEIQVIKMGTGHNDIVDVAELTATRDKLLEQSRSSAVSLQRTRDEWLELQGVVQGGAESVEALKNNKNGLASALESKQADCMKLAEKLKEEQRIVNNITAEEKIGPAALASLDQEIQFLNDQYRGLEKELKATSQRDKDEKKRKVNDMELVEQRKLEAKVKEISERNKMLKAERDQLRRQMVEMDKKKARLEKAIYGDN